MQTAGAKLFSNYKATKRFVAYQDLMDPEDQVALGAEVRKMFDEKITSDLLLNDYYITEKDVDTCYNNVIKAKNESKRQG